MPHPDRRGREGGYVGRAEDDDVRYFFRLSQSLRSTFLSATIVDMVQAGYALSWSEAFHDGWSRGRCVLGAMSQNAVSCRGFESMERYRVSPHQPNLRYLIQSFA